MSAELAKAAGNVGLPGLGGLSEEDQQFVIAFIENGCDPAKAVEAINAPLFLTNPDMAGRVGQTKLEDPAIAAAVFARLQWFFDHPEMHAMAAIQNLRKLAVESDSERVKVESNRIVLEFTAEIAKARAALVGTKRTESLIERMAKIAADQRPKDVEAG